MNQYDVGNEWNLDNESGFSKCWKYAASVVMAAMLFGLIFVGFVIGNAVLN